MVKNKLTGDSKSKQNRLLKRSLKRMKGCWKEIKWWYAGYLSCNKIAYYNLKKKEEKKVLRDGLGAGAGRETKDIGRRKWTLVAKLLLKHYKTTQSWTTL